MMQQRDQPLRAPGRPFTFTKQHEDEMVANIEEAEKLLGVLTTEQMRWEILGYALKPLTEEEKQDVDIHKKGIKARLLRCGGDDFLADFIMRNKVNHATGKAIEAHRAAKMQPEIFLEHFRNLICSYAIAQMHRAVCGYDLADPDSYDPMRPEQPILGFGPFPLPGDSFSATTLEQRSLMAFSKYGTMDTSGSSHWRPFR